MQNEQTFFYNDPRLSMSYFGRFCVRLASYVFLGLLGVMGLVFYISDLKFLAATGLLIIIFFADYFLHLNAPERSLKDASLKHASIAFYVTPETYRILEAAMDQSALEGSNGMFNIFHKLLKRPGIMRALKPLNIPADELMEKIEEHRVRKENRRSKKEFLENISVLMRLAFEEARRAGSDAVNPEHVFRALMKSDNPELMKIFEIFGHKAEEVARIFVDARGV